MMERLYTLYYPTLDFRVRVKWSTGIVGMVTMKFTIWTMKGKNVDQCEFCGKPVKCLVDMIIGGREYTVGLCGECQESKEILEEKKELEGVQNPYYKLYCSYGGPLPFVIKKETRSL
jgi:hypothetical protein